MKTLHKIFLLVSLFFLFLIFFCNTIVFFEGGRGIITDIAQSPNAQIAILLGAGMKKDGSMSLQQQDRVATALALFQARKTEKIYVTGEAGQKKYDEVGPMKRFLMSAGVPESSIIVDSVGFDTFDSLYRAKHVFGISRAVIITQYYHLPRAMFLARALGMEVFGFSADLRQYPRWWYVETRETLARVKAVWNVVFQSKPEVVRDYGILETANQRK